MLGAHVQLCKAELDVLISFSLLKNFALEMGQK